MKGRKLFTDSKYSTFSFVSLGLVMQLFNTVIFVVICGVKAPNNQSNKP